MNTGTVPTLQQEPHDFAEPTDAVGDKTSALSPLYVGLTVVMSVVWAVLMHQFGQNPIYWIMGPYALVISLVLLFLRPHSLLHRLRPNPKHVALGLGMGVFMTVMTYPIFDAAKAIFPELVKHVSDLYAQSQNERLTTATVAVLVIGTAEELLWRGGWFEAWCPRIGPLWAGVLSVVSYALTQLGSGSFIVALLAICCGTVWQIMRYQTGSLLPGLIAHLIWTPTTILFIPVTW